MPDRDSRPRMAPMLIDRLAWWLLLATLALLPFEYRLPMANVGPLVVTTVEVVWGAALVAWLVAMGLNRRRPQVPRTVALALGVLLVGGLASAVLADGFNREGIAFVGRSFAAWLLFIAVAETASRRSPATMGVAIVAGATISAAVGVIVVSVPPAVSEALGFPVHVSFDMRRLVGTLDYPNTAAMFYEAAGLLAVGLLPVARGLLPRAALLASGATLLAAMLLTLSRGAVVGATAGVAALTIVALGAGKRRVALAAAGGAVALVAGALLFQLTSLPVERVLADAGRGLLSATYEAPAVGHLRDGRMDVAVSVTNTGSIAWNTDGGSGYRLGYRWLSPESGEHVGNGDDKVPIGPLAPGQTTVVDATVRALDGAIGYAVAWDVIGPEGVWFSDKGVPVVTTRVAGDADSPGQPSPAGPEVVLFEDVVPPTREELWRAAAAMTAERPLLGVGPGTFRLRYGPYLGLETWDDRTHSNNLYIELAATTGIIGLSAFLLLVGAVLLPLFRRLAGRGPSADAREADEPWLWSAAVGATAVAFLAHGMLDYFLGFNGTAGLFAAVLGLAVVAGRPRS